MSRALLATVFLSGACHFRAPAPVVVEETPQAIRCQPGPDCDRRWTLALEWVVANSHWRVSEATPTLIRTEGPEETLHPAFTIRRVADDEGGDRIVIEAGCSPERVSAVVDHGDQHEGRWARVSGPKAKLTECIPSVPSLEATFERFVRE